MYIIFKESTLSMLSKIVVLYNPKSNISCLLSYLKASEN